MNENVKKKKKEVVTSIVPSQMGSPICRGRSMWCDRTVKLWWVFLSIWKIFVMIELWLRFIYHRRVYPLWEPLPLTTHLWQWILRAMFALILQKKVQSSIEWCCLDLHNKVRKMCPLYFGDMAIALCNSVTYEIVDTMKPGGALPLQSLQTSGASSGNAHK